MLSQTNLCEDVVESSLVGMAAQRPLVSSLSNGSALSVMCEVVANLFDHLLGGVESDDFPAGFIVVFEMCRMLRQEKPPGAWDLKVTPLDLFGAESC